MKSLDRTRIIFIVIVAFALLIVCAAVGFNLLQNYISQVADTNPDPGPSGAPTTPKVELSSPEPIFAPDYDPNDGLPTYICGADAFGSYFALQHMDFIWGSCLSFWTRIRLTMSRRSSAPPC
jgi:hypothetical protein